MFKFNAVSLIRLTGANGAKAVFSASPPGSHDLVPPASPFVTRDVAAKREKPVPMVKLDCAEPIELFDPDQVQEISAWLSDASKWMYACQMMQDHLSEPEEWYEDNDNEEEEE